MPKRYIQMTGNGVKDKLLAFHGMKKIGQEEMRSDLQSKKCYKCGSENPADAKLCRCGFVLSYEGWDELINKEKSRMDLLEGQMKELKEFENTILGAIRMGQTDLTASHFSALLSDRKFPFIASGLV